MELTTELRSKGFLALLASWNVTEDGDIRNLSDEVFRRRWYAYLVCFEPDVAAEAVLISQAIQNYIEDHGGDNLFFELDFPSLKNAVGDVTLARHGACLAGFRQRGNSSTWSTAPMDYRGAVEKLTFPKDFYAEHLRMLPQ